LDLKLIKTGKIRYAFGYNPLPIHRLARCLALAAICAGNQNRYWQMHDHLFEATPKAESEVLSIAERIGLDSTKFRNCLQQSQEPARQIEEEVKQAQKLKLNGTPAFAVGLVNAGGRVLIKKLIIGVQPFEVFESTIASLGQ